MMSDMKIGAFSANNLTGEAKISVYRSITYAHPGKADQVSVSIVAAIDTQGFEEGRRLQAMSVDASIKILDEAIRFLKHYQRSL